MDWSEVVLITFSCVAANHLGLVAAVEGILKHSIPIVNCPKCLTFWTLMICGILERDNFFVTTATSFLFSYLATWLNLLFAIIDTQYNRIYDKIYSTTDTPDAGA